MFRLVTLFIISIAGLIWLLSDTPFGYMPPAGRAAFEFRTVAELPLLESNDVELDPASNVVTANGPDPYVTLRGPFTPAARSVILTVLPISRKLRGFDIYYQTEQRPVFIETQKAAGFPIDSGPLAQIVWALPQPATLVRLDLPERSSFELRSLTLDPRPAVPGRRIARAHLLFVGAAIFVAILFQAVLLRRLLLRQTVVRILVGELAVSLILILLLLPPMQGPDETNHWKFAVHFYRSLGEHEAATYMLADLPEFAGMIFKPTSTIPGERLLYDDYWPRHSPSLPSLRDYAYVHYLSYPFVFLTSLLFPPVTDFRFALLFYYFSRLTPVVALLLVLGFAQKRYHLPYTALIFLSLPLVMQQFFVISPDVFQNIGTLVAVLMFIELYRRFQWRLYAALWALCLAITYSKVILAGVLLLPLTLLPWRGIPHKKWVVLSGIAVVPACILIAGYIVWMKLLGIGEARPDAMRQNLLLLGTPEGAYQFLLAYLRALKDLLNPGSWAGPLGWLDTALNPYHLWLIFVSGVFAVIADLWSYRASFWRIWADQRREVAMVLLICAAAFLFNTLSDCLIFYVFNSEVGVFSTQGIQTRHFFPSMIMLLFLPAMFFRREGQLALEADGVAVRDSVINVAALTAITVLLFARALQLAIDLLSRYWG